ncbi:hypothetical protein [Noviherbaspirillum pedocola]|uniref:Uncharacterized protein n=1 Tax=Noviherbaspirillum pedocola TaxID=2801341 RepID=A0A934SX55_9BURK|nr:hypothetical protein [Noviherbaspirillum pedocola]MBK4737392.1 hypothetical protein [Noviherbaspirillum pedocola]
MYCRAGSQHIADVDGCFDRTFSRANSDRGRSLYDTFGCERMLLCIGGDLLNAGPFIQTAIEHDIDLQTVSLTGESSRELYEA